MKIKIMVLLPAIILLLAACVPSQEQIDQIVLSVEQTAIAQVTVIAPTADVEAIVQATFQALTAQAPILPSATALPTDVPATQGATDNIPTNTPPGGLVGSIAGALGYPAESIPAMAVIAFHAGGGPTDYYYVLTAAGQNSYQLDNLPPGQYTVVAYTMGGGAFPVGFGGGYTQAIACGLTVDCVDHSLIVVTVNAGSVTGGVNPVDFYAPPGSFPAFPLP